jgi:xanthine/uracil permease
MGTGIPVLWHWEANMSKMERSAKTCDRSALQSLEIGFLVVLLTGCVHYFIMASSHFDFLIPDGELYLVTGAILLIIALSLVDFKDALYVLHHMDAPHKEYAKPLSIAGMAMGIAILLPALIILAITIEMQLFRFIQLRSLIEFW